LASVPVLYLLLLMSLGPGKGRVPILLMLGMSVAAAFGALVGWPWGGVLRVWKVRGERAWVTGTGRVYRMRFPEIPNQPKA
jgi:hypothetical protein